jgi:DNA recombination protein RmuC
MGEVQRAQLDGMTKHVQEFSESNHDSLDRLSNALEGLGKELQQSNEQKLDQMRCSLEEKIKGNEEELSKGLRIANETLASALTRIGEFQSTQVDVMTAQFKEINESTGVRSTAYAT